MATSAVDGPSARPRTHFTDACASLWLAGELVPLEDLVLHDAERDIRAPTRALTQARTVLRTRHRIAAADPAWAASPAGVSALRNGAEPEDADELALLPALADKANDPEGEGAFEDDAFASELAAMDAMLERSRQVLAGADPTRNRDRVGGLDRDEAGPLEERRALTTKTNELPPLLAAAVALDAWTNFEPLPRRPWLRPAPGREHAPGAGQSSPPPALPRSGASAGLA